MSSGSITSLRTLRDEQKKTEDKLLKKVDDQNNFQIQLMQQLDDRKQTEIRLHQQLDDYKLVEKQLLKEMITLKSELLGFIHRVNDDDENLKREQQKVASLTTQKQKLEDHLNALKN